MRCVHFAANVAFKRGEVGDGKRMTGRGDTLRLSQGPIKTNRGEDGKVELQVFLLKTRTQANLVGLGHLPRAVEHQQVSEWRRKGMF